MARPPGWFDLDQDDPGRLHEEDAHAISSVISMGPMVRSSSEDFDPWAFAIGRPRRALMAKTDMLNG